MKCIPHTTWFTAPESGDHHTDVYVSAFVVIVVDVVVYVMIRRRVQKTWTAGTKGNATVEIKTRRIDEYYLPVTVYRPSLVSGQKNKKKRK